MFVAETMTITRTILDPVGKASSFVTPDGAAEQFIVLDANDTMTFAAALDDLGQRYSEACACLDLCNSTAVFCRVFFSDIINQAGAFLQSALYKSICSGGVSMIEQCPLGAGMLSLVAYHVKGASDSTVRTRLSHDPMLRRSGLLVAGNNYTMLWNTNFDGNAGADSRCQTEELIASFDTSLRKHAMTLRDNTVRTWDRYLFDDDPETAFAVGRRSSADQRIKGGSFRLDLGKLEYIDRIVLDSGGDYYLQPLYSEEGCRGSVSADLRTWTQVLFFIGDTIEAALPPDIPFRYIRLDGCPDLIRHVRGYRKGKLVDRTLWRASNLFARYWMVRATQAWSLPFQLDEAAPGSYCAVGVHGQCGNEAVYVAMRVGDGYAGAPRRSPSYPSNAWELPVKKVDANYTYYIPLSDALVGKKIEVVALLLKGGNAAVWLDAWITAYPPPYASRELEIY